MGRILVVDDDRTVREIVVRYLNAAGFETREAADGPSALLMAREEAPALVILDLTLPGLDGLEVFRRLRQERGETAVIMLTARAEEPDRILGFEVGADDYVAKPFSPRELVLRVRSLLRRAAEPAAGPSPEPVRQLSDDDLTLDPISRRVTLAGVPLTLTGREFDLLAHFMTYPGVAFSRETLMRSVWGWEFGDSSTVTVHVRRLREKVERDAATPQRIVTVWGVGYRWDGVGGGVRDEPRSDRDRDLDGYHGCGRRRRRGGQPRRFQKVGHRSHPDRTAGDRDLGHRGSDGQRVGHVPRRAGAGAAVLGAGRRGATGPADRGPPVHPGSPDGSGPRRARGEPPPGGGPGAVAARHGGVDLARPAHTPRRDQGHDRGARGRRGG
ncbi:MAG: response regulator transcription factor [Micropruina sp.]|nr:response regulator transcription factor [Micropruina sp.]